MQEADAWRRKTMSVPDILIQVSAVNAALNSFNRVLPADIIAAVENAGYGASENLLPEIFRRSASVLIAVCDLSTADRIFYLSVQLPPCEWGVGGHGAVFCRRPTLLGIEKDQIGRFSDLDPSARKVIKFCRINGHLFQKLHQVQVAGAYKRRDTQGEGSLQTDDAARGSSDGTAFPPGCAGRDLWR